MLPLIKWMKMMLGDCFFKHLQLGANTEGRRPYAKLHANF